MTAQDDAVRAIRRALGQLEPKRTLLPGLLGNGSGLVSGSQPNTSLVRIGNRNAQEIYNMSMPNIEDLPVWVGYAPPDYKRMEVLGFDTSRIFSWGNMTGQIGYIPLHGNTHSSDANAPYSDPVWVQKRMILPLLVRPTTPPSMTVRVYDDYYPYGTSWKRYAGETTGDLSSYIPASGYGVFITLYIDGETNTLQVEEGTPFLGTPEDVHAVIPTPPVGSIPLCAIALTWSTTEIDEDNLFDIRLFINAVGVSTLPLFNDNEGDPVMLAPELSALDGTSIYPTRRDHRHNLKIFNSGTPSGVAASSSIGVSPWASREDHVHSYSPLTDTVWAAKGDLLVAQSNDLAARLSVGVDGQILTADSGETLGVKWATPASVIGPDTDFSGITGLIAHFKSNSGTTVSGGRVTDWDGVASTETATQATTNQQPYYVVNTRLGWPAVMFSNSFMVSDVVPPDADNPRTFVAVVDYTHSVVDAILHEAICAYGNAVDGEGFGLTSKNAGVSLFGYSLFGNASAIESDFSTQFGPAVVILVYDGTDVTIYWNGLAFTLSGSITLTTGTDEPLYIGSEIDESGTATMFLYELAVFDVALDATDRTDIFNQVYAKYGGQLGVAP